MTENEPDRPLTRRERRLRDQAAAAVPDETPEAGTETTESQAPEASTEAAATPEPTAATPSDAAAGLPEIEIEPYDENGNPRTRREMRELREQALREREAALAEAEPAASEPESAEPEAAEPEAAGESGSAPADAASVGPDPAIVEAPTEAFSLEDIREAESAAAADAAADTDVSANVGDAEVPAEEAAIHEVSEETVASEETDTSEETAPSGDAAETVTDGDVEARESVEAASRESDDDARGSEQVEDEADEPFLADAPPVKASPPTEPLSFDEALAGAVDDESGETVEAEVIETQLIETQSEDGGVETVLIETAVIETESDGQPAATELPAETRLLDAQDVDAESADEAAEGGVAPEAEAPSDAPVSAAPKSAAPKSAAPKSAAPKSSRPAAPTPVSDPPAAPKAADEQAADADAPKTPYSFPDIAPPEEWRSVFDEDSKAGPGNDARSASGKDSGFDDLIARAVVQDGRAGGTNSAALILPDMPEDGGLAGPIGGTGELYITGSIDVPKSIGETGGHASIHDSIELDPVDELGAERPHGGADQATGPISARRAVSASSATGAPMFSSAGKEKSKLPLVLSLTGGGLILVVGGIAVWGFATGVFG